MTDALSRLTAALSDRYTIERELGSGGMAVVYLARDLRHDRQVALKVLRPELAASLGAERFLQEVKIAANLTHPHILPLHDSGDAGGFLYYVMPFFKGESLREKLNREKQLSIEQSIEITKAVASALDYAHRQNVIHRDIKPENILLHDGQPVVADFGIALAVRAAGGARLTETGLSLGTPQYMSPEQATADREIDGRSDIYSLACVTYEMLAGEPPHTGPTVQAVMAKVVTDKPRPVTELRDTVPVHVSAAVSKALAKLPADRFENAQGFAKALADVSFTVSTPGAAVPVAESKWWWTRTWMQRGGVFALVMMAAVVGWVLRPIPELSQRPVQFLITSNSAHRVGYGLPAMSPDGSVVVYSGGVDAREMLFQRRLNESESRPIPGTEGGRLPFFSPDGEWLGFWKNRELLKTRLDGGGPQAITSSSSRSTTTWGTRDRIVFSSDPIGRVYVVSANGGTAEPFLPLDTLGPAMMVSQPVFLPGGDAVLFTDLVGGMTLCIFDLESGEARRLGPGTGARYLDSGHLVYGDADGSLVLQPFDAAGRNMVGEASRLDWEVQLGEGIFPKFDVSPGGALVVSKSEYDDRIHLVDRAGQDSTLLSGAFLWVPRFSPDGSRIAYGAWAEGHEVQELWVYNRILGTPTRLTSSASDASDPVWSPDGESLAFDDGLGTKDLFVMSVEGRGEATLLLSQEGDQWTSDWSADGRFIVFTEDATVTGRDIWTLDLEGDSVPRPFLVTEFNEEAGVVSPNGRWLAYQSNESGQTEVYVQSFPEPGSKERVSVDGGVHPAWRSPPNNTGSQHLYFWSEGQLIEVPVNGDEAVEFGDREVVLWNQHYLDHSPHASFDVHPNGQEFVLITSSNEGSVLVALDMLPRER